MYYYNMASHDIGYNLATEQYLMNEKDFGEPLLLFYYQTPCIIVGRNQNTMEEINQDYVTKHNIQVTRRLSGGGAVFDDLGNLSFSFVVDRDDDRFGDFKAFTKPIVDALKEMGATGVEVSGRNDILVDGKKFSGNAMYVKNGKMFSHGTLMLDVDQSIVEHALNVPEDKIKSKGIKSVRSRVTNLKPYLAPEYQNLDVPAFRDMLLKKLYNVSDLSEIADKAYTLTDADKAAIQKLYDDYYNNWDWVYGTSPDFTVKKRQHFDAGTIDARILVKNGEIDTITFFGDFFGEKDASEVADKLKGVRYDEASLTTALAAIDTTDYFSGIDNATLVKLLS
ncbi:lipoate--protein ligase [Secundilactobacillus paracollinoides]|uniref:lipoate--protein ligase n=1 Tax=Secundilactobacillus paracollinoides TaxID=240427 RepID=A0A1B2IWA5_9LACO|nr:lipoate--protein ligase [Secundilactobacillus paracollinoides]ANZ60484.1 lipoate--protein ligase [Secundilactobacillus paracollinoides]ANZ64795.1 lipoate--protein ligase [Secundilactobacillus paracollinoides]ANZ66311.1 lipoate--protein ligase [Secundilactobacillus paracollinoides]KRL77548.1 lipoate-protein ligase A [Secundilactobacillus paracollinoides DSM 15502 = JCM 11969]